MNNNYKNDWKAYWQTGLTTSCLSESKDDYPLAIKSFWIEQVLPLLKDKTQLLDLCSGGAGIPKLLIHSLHSKQTQLFCTSTDYTDIKHKYLNINNSSITFKANCNCETLPFENNYFDCITSSFGIEYSNLDKTLEQIDRVMKPTGIFSAVVHTENSEIVLNSRQQIKQADFIIKKIRFFDLFKNTYLTKRSAKAFQKKADLKFKQALQEVKLQIILSQNSYVYKKLLEVSEIIFNYSLHHSISSVINLINTQERALIQNQNRMCNLINIVNDNNTIDKIKKYFTQKNYHLRVSAELINKNHCVGYGLIVNKR
jgi:ubiquinone/menaquinone biosynthesis C-methylase UbiE